MACDHLLEGAHVREVRLQAAMERCVQSVVHSLLQVLLWRLSLLGLDSFKLQLSVWEEAYPAFDGWRAAQLSMSGAMDRASYGHAAKQVEVFVLLLALSHVEEVLQSVEDILPDARRFSTACRHLMITSRLHGLTEERRLLISMPGDNVRACTERV